MGQFTTLPINNRTFTDYSQIVFARDFGVTADGSTDDTAALNACFASVAENTALVILPKGFCKVTNTIVVGRDGGSFGQSHISIMCVGSAATSGINYNGGTGGIALKVCKNTNWYFSNFAVNNQVAKGTTIGIQLGSNGVDSGTQCTNFYLNGVIINGFHVGVQAGGGNGAASEGTFEQCSIANCDTGFNPIDFNSLDFNFFMLSMGSNGIGIDSGAGDGINVHGGSASFNTTDFRVSVNATAYNITGFRSEVATNFILGNGGKCVVRNCSAVSPAGGTVSITGNFATLDMQDTLLQGSITFTSESQVASLILRNNYLQVWDQTNMLPIIQTTGNPYLTISAIFENNTDISGAPPIPIPDLHGTVGCRKIGTFPFVLFADPAITGMPVDHRNTNFASLGTDYVALNHVKHLSEGSMPGWISGAAGPPTPGQNLRVSGTFASSNTLTINFVRTGFTVSSASVLSINASVGTFFPTDVGKPMKITAGADTGADWYGYITKFNSSTSVETQPNSFTTPGGRPASCVNKAAQVGANEPDGAYFVFISGNANETFWVTSPTTTGFTAHSSNATSTATVTCLIVR